MTNVKIHCVDCGAEFLAGRSTTKRCPKCQALRLKMLRREGKKRYKARQKAKREKSSDNSASPDAICPYCGKPTPNEIYCDTCILYGLDNLHREFGMTNGWDKKAKKEKVEIVPGNRGVIPAGAITLTANSRMY